nr:Cu/Zn superoxide dismutase [Dugesia japonica]
MNYKIRIVFFLICFTNRLFSNEACQSTVKYTNNQYNITNKKAVCEITSKNTNSTITGLIEIHETINMINISGTISGVTPNGVHAFHIHEYGDLRDSCNNAGAHYNPFNKKHGGPMNIDRHHGDLGNVQADLTGTIFINIQDAIVKLNGVNSIIGRSIVLHENKDTFESQPSGNAGKRIACCVIGLV